MDVNERTAFLRADEDDPDYLWNKPEGVCCWCGWELHTILGSAICINHRCTYDNDSTELANRARYAQERKEEAKVESKIKGEM